MYVAICIILVVKFFMWRSYSSSGWIHACFPQSASTSAQLEECERENKGRVRYLQVGVNAPGTPKITTFLSRARSYIICFCSFPSSSKYVSSPSGSLSPAAMGANGAVLHSSKGVGQMQNVENNKEIKADHIEVS